MRPVSLIEAEHDPKTLANIYDDPLGFAGAFWLFLSNPSPVAAVHLEGYGIRILIGRYDSDRVRVKIAPDTAAKEDNS